MENKKLHRLNISNIPKSVSLRSNKLQSTKSPAITTTPLDIFANDIVNHVVSEEDDPLTDSPPQCTSEEGRGYYFDQMQSICDPLNAMEREMFKPKKEINRTPRNSISDPQEKVIKSALKTENASRLTSLRSVRFAEDMELETPAKIAPLIDETPPRMINESGYSICNNEWE